MADDDKRYMGFWIGHLSKEERNRIHANGPDHPEREMLDKGEDPWAKFRGPLPPGIQAYVPPKEAEEIATTAMDELREHVDRQLGGVVNTRVANDAFQQGVKPSSPSPESSDTKESKGVREPTEAEVVAIMHDDDLLEYTSSSPSDRRRNSMFEFYKQQWKAVRAAEERSKKVEALRKTFNSTPETPKPETLADEPPKKYRPSQEQIDQLCRSRNESEAEARAFLESDTRDAKDMLAYLEYEGRQIPPDDLTKSPHKGNLDLHELSKGTDKRELSEAERKQFIENVTEDIAEMRRPDPGSYGFRAIGPKVDWTQTRKPAVRRHRANETPPPAHTNPNEFFKPNRGWFLAAAGVVAVWALYKIDAPLWLGLTTLGLLIACAAVWPWIEKSRIRQRVFWISLTLYAIGACVVAISTSGVNLQEIDGHATSPTPIPSATQLQIIPPLPSQTPKASPTPTPSHTPALAGVPPRSSTPTDRPDYPSHPITVVPKSTPSDNAQFPYGLALIIQSTVEISPFRLLLRCSGAIHDHPLISPAGSGVSMSSRTKIDDRTWQFEVTSPALSPSCPFEIRAASVERVQCKVSSQY